jgi:hypothetical protein
MGRTWRSGATLCRNAGTIRPSSLQTTPEHRSLRAACEAERHVVQHHTLPIAIGTTVIGKRKQNVRDDTGKLRPADVIEIFSLETLPGQPSSLLDDLATRLPRDVRVHLSRADPRPFSRALKWAQGSRCTGGSGPPYAGGSKPCSGAAPTTSSGQSHPDTLPVRIRRAYTQTFSWRR